MYEYRKCSSNVLSALVLHESVLLLLARYYYSKTILNVKANTFVSIDMKSKTKSKPILKISNRLRTVHIS